MKHMVGTVTLALALLLPAVALSRQATNPIAAAPLPQPGGCAADGNRELTGVSAEHLWRLRAYQDLDCAIAILDAALMTPGNVVTVSRHDAERARASLRSARDAAARIGR